MKRYWLKRKEDGYKVGFGSEQYRQEAIEQFELDMEEKWETYETEIKDPEGYRENINAQRGIGGKPTWAE